MASPVDTFKSSLFGQLKSYGDAVQGVFEQRIARPLLAFKRDISRPASTSRPPTDQDSTQDAPPPDTTTNAETHAPLKTMLDKMKNSLSPSLTRRSAPIADAVQQLTRESRHPSVSSLSKKDRRIARLNQQKSVSFADNVPDNSDDHSFADEILAAGMNDGDADQFVPESTSSQSNKGDFQRDFYQTIKPRRISMGNGKDLVYQDLSAEIVAYVLKHAVRSLEQEEEEFLAEDKDTPFDHDEQDDDFVDLK